MYCKCLCRMGQLPRDACFAEYRFDVKIIKYTRVGARKGGKAACHAARADRPVSPFCQKERDPAVVDRTGQRFLLRLWERRFSDLRAEAVFQLSELPVLGIGQSLHGDRDWIFRRQEHQRIAPFVDSVRDKADAFPEPFPPRIAAVIELCVLCAACPGPVQQNARTGPACAVSAIFWVDAVFHQKAFSVLRREDDRHGEADLLPVPDKKQKIRAVLRPAPDLHHVPVIFRADEVFPLTTARFCKNVPRIVAIQLLPKTRDVRIRDCFADGDLVLHVVSSKI